MPKRYQMSEEQMQEIQKARKENKNKNVERRLHALQLFSQGKKNAEVAERTGYFTKYISQLVRKYRDHGIGAIIENKYPGNRRNMSIQQEKDFLDGFKKEAEEGKMIEVSEIKKAYEEKVGHAIGGSQIYCVLRRHGWRKVMPRSKHPEKASTEAIEASKKLTLP